MMDIFVFLSFLVREIDLFVEGVRLARRFSGLLYEAFPLRKTI
jgi:hypothetical protein